MRSWPITSNSCQGSRRVKHRLCLQQEDVWQDGRYPRQMVIREQSQIFQTEKGGKTHGLDKTSVKSRPSFIGEE